MKKLLPTLQLLAYWTWRTFKPLLAFEHARKIIGLISSSPLPPVWSQINKSSAPPGPSPNSNLALFPGLPTVQFIACSMQKQQGKAWSILSREWHQCLPRLTERRRDSLLNIWNSNGLDRNYKISPQVSFFRLGTPPTLCRHWCHSCDKMDQPVSLCSCILQAIN